VRIRAVPRAEPTADDERPGPALPGDSDGSPDRLLPPDLATGVRVRRRATRAGVPPGTPAGLGQPERSAGALGVSRTAPAARSSVEAAEQPGPVELRQAAQRLLGACVEVIGGYRPIGQLRPYCAPERFEAIVNRLLRPVGTARGHGATRTSVVARSTPPRPGRPGHTPPQDRAAVRRVRVCDVADGVAELAVVMSRREKVWAMAMRMERNHGRWQCTHMEVL
jgi:hypothetical protein